jgi:hypothetical protein
MGIMELQARPFLLLKKTRKDKKMKKKKISLRKKENFLKM